VEPCPLSVTEVARNFSAVLDAVERDQSGNACRGDVMSDIMADMKTVTLRSLRRDAAVLDEAAQGQEIVVTRRGKPYVRISPAARPGSFLGAGKRLGQKRPVSPDPIPAREWKGLA